MQGLYWAMLAVSVASAVGAARTMIVGWQDVQFFS